LRVAVVGAGAIGAVLARCAWAAGHEVVVGVRTPISGLALQGPDGTWEDLPVTLLSSPDEMTAPGDVVFLTVKATDTAGAAPWLERMCGPESILAVVQNGLDHVARVAPFAPPRTTIVPGLIYLAAERLAAGRVKQISRGRMIVPTEVVEPIEAAVAPLRVRGTDDVLTATWSKLLANVVANPLTALTLRRVDVLAEPDMAELARGVLREAWAVARAVGAQVDYDLVDEIVGTVGQYGAATGSSMLYDRLAGRPMEHSYITGEVVRHGRRLGIPVPLNTAVLTLLDALDRGVR
jgi:2-dehydropantoate 2-reductase